jgi:hypothetical protein
MPAKPQPLPSAGFVIPEDAHVELIQLHQHLRLQAYLMDIGGIASREDAHLRPDAMAWWFTRVCRDIEAIVDATYWADLAPTK